MTTPTYSHYGGFAEGDHVTRDGTDVHLVKDMTEDGFSATFVCVVEPAGGWTKVGEEELNLCRRYERVILDGQTGRWELEPGIRTFSVISPRQTIEDHINKLRDSFVSYVESLIQSGLLKHIRSHALRNKPAHQRRFHRHYKRRALRK